MTNPAQFGFDTDKPITDGRTGADKYEPTPPWKEIFYQYSQDTTFHGIRLITSQTRWPIRRLIWLAAVTAAISLFVYLMVERLVVYFNYPKAVNVEVTYETSLPFPAVTICNQNLFRLSRLQDQGIFDDVMMYVQDPSGSGTEDTGLDEYTLVGRNCLAESYTPAVNPSYYVEVALSGCQYLCQHLHDLTCSMVLYMPLLRSCILQPVQEVEFAATVDDCRFVEVYLRRRTTDDSRVECDFESECSLTQKRTDQEDWRQIEASLDGNGGKDHTTDSSEGHMFYLLEYERSAESRARLLTPYKQTEDLCLELFYWLRGPSKLEVILRGDDYIGRRQTLADDEDNKDWVWMFLPLPGGVNQIIIDGITAANNISGVLLDDITIDQCGTFTNDCKRSPSGIEYLGSRSLSASGRTCRAWNTTEGVTLPYGSLTDASNYCRRAQFEGSFQQSFDVPWCFTDIGIEACSIPYCHCPPTVDVFACVTGQCLPSSLLCDSIVHCEDGSDEVELCGDMRQVTCDFRTGYICGYDTLSINPEGVHWRRNDGGSIIDDGQTGSSGTFMQIIMSGAQSEMIVPMSSPEHEFDTLHCLSFEYELSVVNSSVAAQMAVYARSNSYMLTGTRLWNMMQYGSGNATITVPAIQANVVLDFVGTIGDTASTIIKVANVRLLSSDCVTPEVTCAANETKCNSGECVPLSSLCDGVTDCMDESDEQQGCNLTASCSFDPEDTGNCGYRSSSTFKGFQWVRVPEFTFDDEGAWYLEGCNRTYTSSSDYVMSLYHPDHYAKNLDCRYKIILPEGTRVNLVWEFFDIEYSSVCGYDWVEIFDTDGSQIGGRYCGVNFPPDVLSSGNTLTITLTTDNSVHRDGFKASYISVGPGDSNAAFAAIFSSHDPYPNAVAFALAPSVDVEEPTCLTFRYFMRSNLAVKVTSSSVTTELASFNVDGGRSLHRAFIDLPMGAYRILWETLYDLELVLTTIQEFDLYRAAIDDIVLNPGNCSQLRSASSSLACNFTSEDVCGWQGSSTGPLQWSRVKIGSGATSYYVFAAGALSADTVLPRVSSPVVAVSESNCMLVEFACVFCVGNYSLEVFISPEDEPATSSLLEDLPANLQLTRSFLIPNGTYNVSLKFYVSNGYIYIREVTQLATRLCLDGGMDTNEALDSMDYYVNLEVIYYSSYYFALPTYYDYYYTMGDGMYPPPDVPTTVTNPTTMGGGMYLPPDVTTTIRSPTTVGGMVPPTGGDITTGSSSTTDMSNSQATLVRAATLAATTATLASTTAAQNQRRVVTTPLASIELIPSYSVDNISYGLEVTGDVSDFFWFAGHQQEDFIYACYWDGSSCNNSFQSVLTDLGLCYTFNGDKNNVLKTNKTGAGFGLSLVINIEQYEYIAGPNTDAGIKVHLHDQGDIPQIKNLGFAVSPGVHSLVAGKLSELSALPEPHGTCGEADMYMYSPGTAYTYSRCTEQCYTQYANDECGCVDAYMPRTDTQENCNLTHYLSCLLPIEYYSGFRITDCVCPDACGVKSFGAELSYAALSTLSVENLLDSDVRDLTQKYHKALEIQQRVVIENIQQTVEDFQDLIANMNTFLWLTVNYTGSALGRVNSALYKISAVAQSDIQTMKYAIGNYKETFDEQYANRVDPVITFMDNMAQVLNYLEKRVLVQNQLHGQPAFVSAVGSIAMLYNALLEMSVTETIPPDSYSLTWAPARFWSTQNQSDYCTSLLSSEALAYLELEDSLNEAIDDWTVLDQDMEEERSYSFRTSLLIQDRQASTGEIMGCALEYKRIVTNALLALEELEATIEVAMNSKFDFNFGTVLDSVNEEMLFITGNITWFSKELESYSRNTTSKYNLSGLITTSTVAALEQTLDSVISKLDIHALSILQGNTEEVRVNNRWWLHSGLQAMSTLTPYFDNTNLDDAARTLQMWRIPVAELDTPDILRYTYQASEYWRTWPRSISLNQFLSAQSDTAFISSVLITYGNVLYDEMYSVELEFINAKKQITSALQALVDDLNAFREESNINKDFILTNFLKMDVYFAALKFEKVEQMEAYGTLNFLSEMGGYMGLLIGASCLTLCEVLDLIIYNLFLKCMDKAHRKKAVSIIVNPSAKPVDNTQVHSLETAYSNSYEA